MKYFISLLVLVSQFSSANEKHIIANHFLCTDNPPEGTNLLRRTIEYTASRGSKSDPNDRDESKIEEKLVTELHGEHHSYNPTEYKSNQIRKEFTEVGSLVSVTTEVDINSHLSILSLVLPTVRLKNPSEVLKFKTILIETKRYTNKGGADFLLGALTEATPRMVACNANRLESDDR